MSKGNEKEVLRRELKSRHIRFIALGSGIGTGLFYGSSSAIQTAGPAVLLAYIACGAVVFMVMRALGEMTVHSPISGSFSYYASTYLGPIFGFIVGWTYAFEMIIVCIADVTAFGVYMGLWFPAVDQWIWVISIVLIIGALNLSSIKVFGEIEFWLSMIKVFSVLAMILGGISIILFDLGDMTINNQVVSPGISNIFSFGGLLPKGWGSILASLTIVIFSFGGIEIIGITAGEAKDPKRAIPKAINAVPLRILIFYILTILIIMIICPWNQIDTRGSPFVQIFHKIGVNSVAAILNIVVIIAVISAVNSDIFGAGRTLYNLSHKKQAPAIFGKLSKLGTPWVTVLVIEACLLLGALLNYLAPKKIFIFAASLATFATLWVWLIILISQIAMRRSMSREESSKLEFPVPFWPVAPIVATGFIILIFLILGYYPTTRKALIVGAIWISFLLISYYTWVYPNGKNKVRSQG